MIYRVTWWLVRTILLVFFRYRVVGREHVPATGAVILASNHVSNLDPPVLGCSLWRRGAFMAKDELFRKPLAAWFIGKMGAYPVKRGAPDRASLKRSLDTLANDGMLAVFPEGTRSETGELQEPEMGVGLMAYRSGALVVPVYISGTERVLPRSGGMKLAPITVTFGPPIRFVAAEGERAGREEYEAAARRIMAAIAAVRDGRALEA